MSYFAVAVYTLEGDFIGYAIKGPLKLQSTNLYTEREHGQLNARLNELNVDVDLKLYWPNPKDPAVLQILADERFMPLEYVEAEVVDEDRSYYVWEMVNEVDEHGNPTGQQVQGENLDKTASVINYKLAKVPKNPSDMMLRIKAACEVVARDRAKLAGVLHLTP